MRLSPLAAVLMLLVCSGRSAVAGSELSGRVLFSSAPVPGAQVIATLGDEHAATTTDANGAFHFHALQNGTWRIQVEMRGFFIATATVTVPMASAAGPTIELSMRPLCELVDCAASPPPALSPAAPVAAALEETRDQIDPAVVLGSSVNGAASDLALPSAFGNNRPRAASPYNLVVSSRLSLSSWNARPFTFGGAAWPSASRDDVQAAAIIGGPLKIPRLMRSSADVLLSYDYSTVESISTHSALVPTAAMRAGDFSTDRVVVKDPLTGRGFPGNVVPADRMSPQAAALLAYYPATNAAAAGANYQRPLSTATSTHQVRLRFSKTVAPRSTLTASGTWQRAATTSDSLFAFRDATAQSSLSWQVGWSRRLGRDVTTRLTYRFTRDATGARPFFARRSDVSADAGIAGNDHDPGNWGPPTLAFPDIAGLTDIERQAASRIKNIGSVEILVKHATHHVTLGGDVRAHRATVASAPNARGTLTFTGAASGLAFADFLLGLPAASTIALTAAETRLNAPSYSTYVSDDWRPTPTVTLDLGVRWEYEATYSEAAGHLANLDVAPHFTAVQQVLATSPTGPITGSRYPVSLVRGDKGGVQPRLAGSWRPLFASSLVIRGGYGIYNNLGVYESLALLLAAQPPFAKAFTAHGTPDVPLSLANPFTDPQQASTNTIAVEPDLRAADVHTWFASAQRDFSASWMATAAYLGAKGTNLLQAVLPNTYPPGGANPCPACPSNFLYITSSGSSLRNAAQFTLRRRLRNGWSATASYTLAKANDDAATLSNQRISPASLTVVQNWLTPAAERGPSSFDQRHVFALQFQYTTGGTSAGRGVDARWRRLWKDWIISAQLGAGSGLPYNPVVFTAIPGTGTVGMRPSLTGISRRAFETGVYANPAAYAPPAPGTWGTAERNSLRGPAQRSVDASLGRAMQLGPRLTCDWRVTATNVLNQVTFAGINAVVASPQFGRPVVANPMRRVATSLRLRF